MRTEGFYKCENIKAFFPFFLQINPSYSLALFSIMNVKTNLNNTNSTLLPREITYILYHVILVTDMSKRF